MRSFPAPRADRLAPGHICLPDCDNALPGKLGDTVAIVANVREKRGYRRWSDFRSDCIAGIAEEVAAFLRMEAFEGAGSRCGRAQRRLEFGEGLLDRVEIGAVGRQSR